MTSFQITTNLDEAFGGGTAAAEAADGGGLSLREAIGLSNASAGLDLITLNPSLAGQTIALTQAEPVVITDDLVLIGNDSLTGARLSLTGGTSGHRLLEINGATVVASGLSLEGGSASDAGGGVLVHDNAILTLANAKIGSNTSATNGGGIASNGDLAFVGGIIEQNAAVSGGGVYLGGPGEYAIFRQAFFLSGAAGDGAGLFSDGRYVSIEESRFNANTATGDGGAMYGRNGALIVANSSDFVSNFAQNGGSVAIRDGAFELFGVNSYLSDSASQAGGSIHGRNAAIDIRDAEFSSNSATLGGAIYLSGGGLHLDGARIYDGSAAVGGAIYSRDSADLSLANSDLNYNFAQSGGALAAHASNITLENIRFADNSASVAGGGLLLTDSSSLAGSGVSFYRNSAANGGGLATDASTAVLEVGFFDSNTASGNGGGVHAANSSSVAITTMLGVANQAANGGVAAAENSALRIDGGDLFYNSATGKGGAIYTSGSAVSGSGGIGAAIQGFTQSVADLASNGALGKLGPMNGSSLTVLNSAVYGNSAADGAAIAASYSALALASSFIQDNQVTGDGGGLHLQDSAVTLTNTTVSGNIALGAGLNSGGGIYSDDSDLTILSSTITRNTSDIGGGIFSNGAGPVHLVNSILGGNAGLQGEGDLSGAHSLGGNNLIGNELFEASSVVAFVNAPDAFLFVNPAPQSTVTGGMAPFELISGDPRTVPLLPNSTAHDAGDTNALPRDVHDLDQDGNTAELLPVDGAGNPRITGATVDLGAAEIEPFAAFTGNNNNNVFIGSSNTDVADGQAGDDLLIGKDGDDILIGGPGDDTIIGGKGFDVAVLDGNFADWTSIIQLTPGQIHQAEAALPSGETFLDGGEVFRFAKQSGPAQLWETEIVQAEFVRFDDVTDTPGNLLIRFNGGGSAGSISITDPGFPGGFPFPPTVDNISDVLASLPGIFTPNGFDLLGL